MAAGPALKVAERVLTGIELGESHFREFKSALDQQPSSTRPRDVKLICRDIAETLVAFANADGGELYVGVEDDGTVSGISHNEEGFKTLINAGRSHVHKDTPLPLPTIFRVNLQGKTLLYFSTTKSTDRVHLTSDGRCLQRFDKENRPVPAEQIQYSRQEQKSREYDRAFLDGATLQDLDVELIDQISKHIAGGQSPEKFLQYLDIAEYTQEGIHLRRAALLLFAKDISKWHPRCEIRIVRVSGTALGVGAQYNVNPSDDHTVRDNVLRLREKAWETLKTYLVRTKLVEGLFRESLIYPEDAALEALVNAIAHRDYSIEGKGIEVFLFDDRLEVKSPGGLLSSISLDDLKSGKRAHQSRNVYIARVLREIGYMREMGEGMLRIFSTMRDLDLVAPDLIADSTKFDVVLHHKSVFSPRDQEWLRAYHTYDLSRDEQRTILLGRDGHLLSTNEIMKALGIIDTDQFRQLVERLRRKGILYNASIRPVPKAALRASRGKREVGRYAVRPPDQTEQYRQELEAGLSALGARSFISSFDIRAIISRLSPSSPYREKLGDSLKLLGLVDEKMRPLPRLTAFWNRDIDNAAAPLPPVAPPPTELLHGEIVSLIRAKGFGFIRGSDKKDYFFHRSNLLNIADWGRLTIGTDVNFERSIRVVSGKQPAACTISLAD